MAERIRPLMRDLFEAPDARRITLFVGILDLIGRAGQLASTGFQPNPSATMNSVAPPIARDLSKTDPAKLSRQSVSTFPRPFRKRTGKTLVHHVGSLRIKLACHNLSQADLTSTDPCCAVGFSSMSNFNRQFLAAKGVPPSKFRTRRRDRRRFALPEGSRVFGGATRRSRAADQHATNVNEPASADERETSMIRYTKAPMLRTQAAAALALGLLGGTAASAATVSNTTVAFLMPDQSSTRYEEHDHPGFVAQMQKLCPSCKVLYQNADGDASRQQQQFNSVVSQGAKAIVLDPVDSAAAASLVKQAQGRGIKVIAYDRPIPSTPADYYVSFNNEEIGKSIAKSLVDHLKASNVATTDVGLLEINGSPTDAAAGLIKKGVHEGLAEGGYATLAEYDTPEWAPPKAQQWAAGQISRFNKKIVGVVAANDGTAGGAIAAFKAAGVNPVPPVTGNDATIAGLQLIISGDQYNTISKPSEVVAAAAADVAIALLGGEAPKADTTLFGTPTRLFTPALVTTGNLKTEIIDKTVNGKPIETAKVLCIGRYAEGCKKLGIAP
jgi:D-xylose transport system substrate-binding protein